MFGPNDIEALSNMLATSEKLHEEKLAQQEAEAAAREAEAEAEENDYIVPETNVLEASDDEVFEDTLPEPKYRVLDSQDVKPEEVYGGFMGLTPGTGDSQWLVVEVTVSPENARHADLDVTKHHMLLRLPGQRLYLRLPHPVDPERVKAKFMSNKGVLRVEMHRLDLLIE